MQKEDCQIVWIVGASSGIGEALALQKASASVHLILSGRSRDKLESLAQTCEERGAKASVIPLDLTEATSIDLAAKSFLNQFDRIDLLILNAGISQRSLAAETTQVVDRQIMETNFFGPVALCKQSLALMKNQSQIAVISSLAGKFGVPNRTAYAASKHALHGFFESLRLELPFISITMVCPGVIQTGIAKHALIGSGKSYGNDDPIQMNGMPVEACAAKIIKGIDQRKREIWVGGKEIFSLYIHRFFPSLLARILKKKYLKSQVDGA